MKRGSIVTIDGPSGAGKSTVARQLAERLRYRYIDTGAMYRAIGWLARERKVPFHDGSELHALLESASLSFEEKDGSTRILVNGTDVTGLIRKPDMGMVASDISAIEPVRRWLSSLQRKLGEQGNAVLEGRDMGTVVFPDADYKFFLTASLYERARRRAEQIKEKGDEVDLDAVIKEVSLRDRNDSTRSLSPLRKAEDAVEIDTTSMTIQEAVERLIREIRTGRGKNRGS